MTTYAIAGATSLPLSKVSGHILHLMLPLIPGQDRVIVRGRKPTHPGDHPVPLAGPDAMVAAFAAVLHLELEIEPLPASGTHSDMERAENMVAKSDVVLTIFDPLRGHVGGTSHLVVFGIKANKLTIAYDYWRETDRLLKAAEWDVEPMGIEVTPDGGLSATIYAR